MKILLIISSSVGCYKALDLIRIMQKKNIDFEIIMKLICQNIDLIVHMENHKITQIIQVLGSESGSPFHEIIYEHVI